MNFCKKFIGLLLVIALFIIGSGAVEAASFIVEDGEPNAEIIVNKEAPRMTRLASLELQYYLKKMSGAKVPIVFEKTDTDNIKIYIGKSKYTDETGVDDKGLKYGAFRMVSGADYLVLLGDDYDFNPKLIKIKWDKDTEEFKKAEATTEKEKKNLCEAHLKNGGAIKGIREFLMNLCGHAHGLVRVHSSKEMNEKHPEYYALTKNGKRITDYRGYVHVCYSSEGLVKATLKYARFRFNEYDQPHVSIWPCDGFVHCQCDLCKTQSPSDLVWGFVDRVARELYKDYPDRIVSCGAYTSYKRAPES